MMGKSNWFDPLLTDIRGEGARGAIKTGGDAAPQMGKGKGQIAGRKRAQPFVNLAKFCPGQRQHPAGRLVAEQEARQRKGGLGGDLMAAQSLRLDRDDPGQRKGGGQPDHGVGKDHKVMCGNQGGVIDAQLIVDLDRDAGQAKPVDARRQRRPQTIVATPGIAVANHKDPWCQRHCPARSKS